MEPQSPYNSPFPAVLHYYTPNTDMEELSLDASTIRTRLEELRALWTSKNQGHVFRWVDTLNDKQAAQLLEDLSQIDVAEVNQAYKDTVTHEEDEKVAQHDVKPFTNVARFEDASTEQRSKWKNIGLDLIAEGKVGVLLLAGGQASRLGCLCPKGTYDIGLPSKKSLYQLQVERTVKLQRIAAAHKGIDRCNITWYIMTSPATYTDTVAFFYKNKFFGEPAENFLFFNQATLPCLQPDGKIINESAGKVALAPNGNGGLYRALRDSGALVDMDRRGIKYITQYCVDNVLIRVADPVFLGYMHEERADCAAKVCCKAYPEEPVGVMCLLDGKPNVIEYSEIAPALRNLRDPSTNQLIYNYAHICINSFSVELLKEIANKHLNDLSYHVARKKIPYAGENGETITAKTENGWKLEKFIFDAFKFSKKMVAYEVRRDEEFSPLKNAAGMAVPKDSPETCLADVSRLHARYLTNAGATISDPDAVVEISPIVSYAGEDLEFAAGQVLKTPVYIKN